MLRSRSTFSTAFLLALLLSTQWVDARRFAVKSASGLGTDVEVESKEGQVWTDGRIVMSINMGEGAENIPVDSGLEEKAGPCSTYKPDGNAIAKCKKFLADNGCKDGKLDCNSEKCTCCCK